MFVLNGHSPNALHWDFVNRPYEEEGVTIRVHFDWEKGPSSTRISLQKAEDYVRTHAGFEWLTISKSKWTVNVETLKERVTGLKTLDWLSGKIDVDPEIEREERSEPIHDTSRGMIENRYVNLRFVLVITRDSMKKSSMTPPVEIQESLARLKADHPDDAKTAFVMMRFGSSPAHDKIVSEIKKTLAKHGLVGLRADDREYHDDILSNIITYIYGCKFGIAVFERLVKEDFNPNVSFEVGYMMALRKPVCLLKDHTYPMLHADLVGKLYRPFDTQAPAKTIRKQLESWMKEKRIVPL